MPSIIAPDFIVNDAAKLYVVIGVTKYHHKAGCLSVGFFFLRNLASVFAPIQFFCKLLLGHIYAITLSLRIRQ